MLATYAACALVLASAAVVGQALHSLCGRREWSWLAPAVGLAVLTALAWGAVRLPGEGAAALVVLGVVLIASTALLSRPGRRPTGLAEAARRGLPVALLGLIAASLPFVVEGRFGILGTGLNPDMSQHLFAADRLVSGGEERLIGEGYPLGPHAIVVAVAQLGPGLVQAFDGLTLATGVIACLAPLALFAELSLPRRTAGALLIGLPYLAAAFLVQGAFKETMQALFVLAFAIGLHELAHARVAGADARASAGASGRWRGREALAALPLVALGVGSAYAYSFPGLAWLVGAAVLWAAVELALVWWRDSPARALALVRRAAPTAGIGLGALAVALAPEAPRMASFASFETFDPDGAGLGNLFNRISPLEALGIWPSGDFRLDPGAGFAPALAFYLGGALALAAVIHGLLWWLRRGERAVPAGLATAAALWAYAYAAGTPYQESKALVVAAPLAMLVASRPLFEDLPALGAVSRIRDPRALAIAGLGSAFLLAAAFCSVLALVNGPVGPTSYTPALAELRPLVRDGSALVLAPERLLAEEHGRDYLVWELRGGRVCVQPRQAAVGDDPPAGVAHVIVDDGDEHPPFTGLTLRRRADGYALWQRRPAPVGPGPCPLIASGQRADPGDPG
jgi:hypothetical protein